MSSRGSKLVRSSDGENYRRDIVTLMARCGIMSLSVTQKRRSSIWGGAL